MEKKDKKIESVDSVVVSSSVLANLFSLTTRRIRQLENEGVVVKSGHGRYKLTENIKNYITYLKASQELKEEGESESKIDFDHEHALLERRRREKLDLEIAAIKGTMHKSEDVEKVMNDMLANFRSKILALPSKLAPRLIAREEIGQIENMIREEVFDALNELSNYDPTEFYCDKYVDMNDLEDEDEEDGQEEKEDTD